MAIPTVITMAWGNTMQSAEPGHVSPRALLRLQSWLSPAFPTGAYSYSHALEAAVDSRRIHDRASLADWLDADLRYGSGRNEAIFFVLAWRAAAAGDRARLLEIADLAIAFRGTSEFALEASQQGASCLATMHAVWPDPMTRWLADALRERCIQPVLPVVIGVRVAREGVPVAMAVRTFLQAFVGQLVNAGVRLIPLGQTDGQRAIAALEPVVARAAAAAQAADLDELGSAAPLLDWCSMQHETQYTRLFRS